MSISLCLFLGLGAWHPQLPHSAPQPGSRGTMSRSAPVEASFEQFAEIDLSFAEQVDKYDDWIRRVEQIAATCRSKGDEKDALGWEKVGKLFKQNQINLLEYSLHFLNDDIGLFKKLIALDRAAGDEKSAERREKLLNRIKEMHTKLSERAQAKEKQEKQP
jgi:hypothetical protein